MLKRLGSSLKPRSWIQFIHLWSTLLVGAFIVLLVMSGTALLFRPELEPLLYRDLYRVSPGPSLGLDRALESVKTRYPDSQYEVRDVELPTMTHGAYRIPLNSLEDGPDGSVFVDPGTARINGFMVEDSSVFDWLLALHKRLLVSGNFPQEESFWGHTFVGLLGLALTLMLITGLVLWWPRMSAWKAAFTLRRKNAFVWNYSVHKLVGILTLVPLLTIVSIILPHTFFNQANSLLEHLNWPRGKPTQVFGFSGNGSVKPLETLIQAAEEALPGSRAVKIKASGTSPAEITLNAPYDPSRGTGRYEGNVTLFLDRYTAKPLGQTDTRVWPIAAQLVDGPMYMGIHAGTWGGLLTRLLELVVGLGTLYLAWTGMRQWWLKRVKRRQARSARAKSVSSS